MILYIDIETAPEHEIYFDLSPVGQRAFEKKFQWRVDKEEFPNIGSCYNAEAPLHAEFAKVICIATGTEILDRDTDNHFFAKGLIGEEAAILTAFDEILKKLEPNFLCAHNGKRFDYPFLVKRYIINGLPIPQILNTGTKKPWEVDLLDTAEIWRGLDIGNYTSLLTLCHCLKVASPKVGIGWLPGPGCFLRW